MGSKVESVLSSELSPDLSPDPAEIDLPGNVEVIRGDVIHGPRYYSIPVPAPTLASSRFAALSSPWSVSAGKRVLDMIGAGAALIVLCPVFLIVALMVACSSTGPVLFRQRRMGRLGELFTIYKFRTMRAVPHHRGPVVTQYGDCRITRAGRLLRRYKLDELPQFYNVLRGDMSLVGPRPKLPHHEGMHMPFRPGITGAATLAFRCEEEMLRHVPEADLEFYYSRSIKPLKMQLDSRYMESATLRSDVLLLARTAAACAVPRFLYPFLKMESAVGSFDLETFDVAVSEVGDPCC